MLTVEDKGKDNEKETVRNAENRNNRVRRVNKTKKNIDGGKDHRSKQLWQDLTKARQRT